MKIINPKQLNPLLILIIFIIMAGFQSCDKETMNHSNDKITGELFEINEYNKDLRDFSLAVKNALKENADFRKLVKAEALQMVDGDYDVILRKVKDKKIQQPSLLKSGKPEYTVKELLEQSYSSLKVTKLKSSASVIDQLSAKYPDLQIAVPVHAEDWDEDNYIPVVTFLPAEYDDATTTTLTGYDAQGNIVGVDVLNTPDKPVIVISQNERAIAPGSYPDKPDLLTPPPEAPVNLSGVQTESGIRLTWSMPSSVNSYNIEGFYIFRKNTDATYYDIVGTASGTYNRSYNDNTVGPGKSYSYYVMSYAQDVSSLPSNYITVVAPNYPKPVISFDAIQHSKNEIELRWENDISQYVLETKLYKHIVGVNSGYDLLKTFSSNSHYYFDNNITAGKTITYKINHITSIGESNARYDFVKTPYRDLSQKSPVYIKQIKFSDWRIERWPAGKPEFYITVNNVDEGGKSPFTVQDQINCKFSSRSSTSQIFKGVKIMDWEPGYWYDRLTFTVIEYDRPSSSIDIEIGVEYNKKNISKTGLDAAVGVKHAIKFDNNGEKCGSSYLNYFDNPEQWLVFPNYGVKILVSEKDN